MGWTDLFSRIGKAVLILWACSTIVVLLAPWTGRAIARLLARDIGGLRDEVDAWNRDRPDLK